MIFVKLERETIKIFIHLTHRVSKNWSKSIIITIHNATNHCKTFNFSYCTSKNAFKFHENMIFFFTYFRSVIKLPKKVYVIFKVCNCNSYSIKGQKILFLP